MTPRARRRLRTALLGVVACAALFWGAIDLVGVPVANLLKALLEVTVGIGLVILAAVVPAALLNQRKKRKSREP